MKNFIFLDPTGTWRGNEFPEEPGRCAVPGGACNYTNNDHHCECDDAYDAYEAVLEKAKSDALEVSNPEMLSPHIFKFSGGYGITTGKLESEKVKEGVLYPWEGEWEIEYQWRPYDTQEWQNTNPHYWSTVGLSNPIAQKRQVLRLLLKSPVIAKKHRHPLISLWGFSEGSKGAGDDYPVIATSDIYDMGSRVDPSGKEYGTELTLSKDGIVATGEPEQDEDLFSPEEEVWIGHVDQMKSLPTLEALGYLLDLMGIKDIHDLHNLKAAPVNDAVGGDQLHELFIKHRRMGWAHEYAENGIINFEDLNKIVSELAQPSPQANPNPVTMEDVQEAARLAWNGGIDEVCDLLKAANTPLSSELSDVIMNLKTPKL